MKGFFCKAVMINVTDRTSTIRHLDEALLRASIGGKGLGAKLLLEYNQPGIDPLGPENHMIIASGPLAGSSLSSCIPAINGHCMPCHKRCVVRQKPCCRFSNLFRRAEPAYGIQRYADRLIVRNFLHKTFV